MTAREAEYRQSSCARERLTPYAEASSQSTSSVTSLRHWRHLED